MSSFSNSDGTSSITKSEATQRPVIEWFKQQESSGMVQTMPIEVSDRFHSWRIRVFINRFMLYLLMPLFYSLIVLYMLDKNIELNDLYIGVGVFGLIYSLVTIEPIFFTTRRRGKLEREGVRRLVKLLYFETLFSAGYLYGVYFVFYIWLFIDSYILGTSVKLINMIPVELKESFHILGFPYVHDTSMLIRISVLMTLIFLCINFIHIFLRTRRVNNGFDRS